MSQFKIRFLYLLWMTLFVIGCGTGSGPGAGIDTVNSDAQNNGMAHLSVRMGGANSLKAGTLSKTSIIPADVNSVILAINRGGVNLFTECKEITPGSTVTFLNVAVPDGSNTEFIGQAFSVAGCGGIASYQGSTTGVTLVVGPNPDVPVNLSLVNATAPTVTTDAATIIVTGCADLNGTINPNGFEVVAWFEWGIDTTYGSQTKTVQMGNGTAAVALTEKICGLAAGTYHYRAVASNGGDQVFGLDQSFIITVGDAGTDVPVSFPGLPTATTEPTSAVTGVSATLHATINPEGAATQGYFEWGLDTTYGSTTFFQALGNGFDDVAISAALTGLTKNTVYHFRAVGFNSFGTTVGADEVLTTLDDTTMIIFSDNFEGGIGTWSASNGVWDVGTPTSGPGNCRMETSVQCAATELAGNYGTNTDSRFFHSGFDVPATPAGAEIHLRFRHWFSYNLSDSGQVQVSVLDPATSTYGAWVSEGTAIVNNSGWTLKDVDLTAYAGERIRIGFLHTAVDNGGFGTGADVSTGWYIDDIVVVKKVPVFTGDFEAGLDDWGADRGVWQIGAPTAGPADCDGSTQCAGTVLDGNYPTNTDSRLISATVQLPTVTGFEEVHLRFRNWFSYNLSDLGKVQVSVLDPATSTFGAWVDEGTPVTNASGWSPKDVDLTAYAGKTVRIAFYHIAVDNGGFGTGVDVSSGWYIDDITIQTF